MRFVTLVCLISLCGCITPKEYVYLDDPKCVGYGDVNAWHQGDQADKIEKVAKAGADVYHFEYLGWGATRLYTAEAGAEAYHRLITAARKRKVVAFVSALNDNSHLPKYDNTPTVYSMAELNKVLDIIMAEGPEGVIVQPVGETQTSRGREFETAAWHRLTQAGFRTCYNRGSRPTSVPLNWTYAAFHPTSIDQTVPAGVACVTDTGAILRDGGWPRQLGGYHKFDPNMVRLYGERCRVWGVSCTLYGFLHPDVDTKAIEALAEVMK